MSIFKLFVKVVQGAILHAVKNHLCFSVGNVLQGGNILISGICLGHGIMNSIELQELINKWEDGKEDEVMENPKIKQQFSLEISMKNEIRKIRDEILSNSI